MKGERVAILGQSRDGPLAHAIAAQGGRVVASVGVTTTMLAIAGAEPYPVDVRYHAQFLKADGLRRAGHPIRILPEAALFP